MAKLIIEKVSKEIIGILSDSDDLSNADNGFECISIKDKTEEDILKDIELATPEVRHMWYDKITAEWKEVKEFPKSRVKYVDGKIVHNFDDVDNIEKVNK